MTGESEIDDDDIRFDGNTVQGILVRVWKEHSYVICYLAVALVALGPLVAALAWPSYSHSSYGTIVGIDAGSFWVHPDDAVSDDSIINCSFSSVCPGPNAVHCGLGRRVKLDLFKNRFGYSSWSISALVGG
jgi:hypothetical protein